MRRIVFIICTFALVPPTFATDHGPAFGYATSVNSQGAVSCDVGVVGRQGSHMARVRGCVAFGYIGPWQASECAQLQFDHG